MYSNIRKKTAAMGCLGWTIAIIGCVVLYAHANPHRKDLINGGFCPQQN